MTRNTRGAILAVMLSLVAALACGRLSEVRNSIANISTDDPKTYKDAGKEWKAYELEGMDITADLPGKPTDQTPPLPASYRSVFSAMRIHSYDEKDFSVGITEIIPTGKRKWTVKELADTSMAAVKKQRPDLTYTLDIQSESNAKYNGTFIRGGKPYDLRGCCIYKKSDPARVWAVIALYAADNPDAKKAGQRVIDSVVFNGSNETCKYLVQR